MKKRHFCHQLILLLVFAANLNGQIILPSGSSLKSLNGTWRFKYIPSVDIGPDSAFYKPDYNAADWNDIKVPGHWDLQGFADPQYGGGVKPGTGLYRTEFSIPTNWNQGRIFIDFEGVLYGYDFWVNGKYAGTWGSAFNRKIFDLTGLVIPGKKNSLAVKVTTRNKGWEFDTNDCWGLSGIFRDVTLVSVSDLFFRDVTVKTYLSGSNAQVDLTLSAGKSNGTKFPPGLVISGKLTSPEGKTVKEFTVSGPGISVRNDTASSFTTLNIVNPKLWTAETPWLYDLEFSLISDGRVIQKFRQKTGIRQVSIEDGILKLNGKPIKLRGVDHHDLDPVAGRALTRDMILKDLLLIKKANINFIRTSHYPSHPLMMDLCDSMGIYVMCEVPFGYDGGHLGDSTYLDILLKRAQATLQRDKNHPSVIVWSVGNENPLTDICLRTGEYVKRMDDTRPICYPMVGSYFRDNYKTIPSTVDIFTPHYGNAETLENYARLFDRPIIATEYAHALGLDFDKMETMWEVMYKYPRIAGGGVWHFHDQGILRKAEQKADVNLFTYSAWPDSVHYYDTNGNKGADGLVYANRVPQVDYWEVRKVYAPVKVLTDTIQAKSGKQDVTIRIQNRFDFSDLTGIKCKWSLTADNKPVQEGSFTLKCAPHQTASVPVTLQLPERLTAAFYLLNLRFYDQENYQFTEKTIRLLVAGNPGIEIKKPTSGTPGKSISNENDTYSVKTGGFVFNIEKQKGTIRMEHTGNGQLLLEGPFARAGRKPTLSIETLRLKDQTGVSTNWEPWFLKNTSASVNLIPDKGIGCKYRFERADKKGEFIEGEVNYTASDSGRINVDYRFKPVDATGFLLEAGLSLKVPSRFTELRWIGQGPYPSYPGKSRLNEFGFYHLNGADLNYQGNRSEVQILLVTDRQGNGIAILCRNADMAVERTPDGILLSHNALVSGRYNKNSEPDFLYRADKVKQYSGQFSILPLNGKSLPPEIVRLFGDLSRTAVPFKPFYHSYDQ